MSLCRFFMICLVSSLFFTCGFATLFAAEASSAVPQFSIENYELSNGLKVALNPDASAPRTTICLVYHVGSKNERPGLTGFAHFFEHMMFRGTKNVPNFDVPLQQAGGSPNAFTSEDVTVYFETVPNEYLKRALYMEAERMAFLSSDLEQEKFDTEREVVKNERRQRMENQPYGLADEAISSYVYPEGHPYSWSVIGSMKDLDSATLDDLRQFFLEFYHPGNASLTLVGGFDPAEAKEWIESLFGSISRGPQVTPVEAPAAPSAGKRVVQKDQVQFPRVYWAWPTVAESHPDAAALDMLASILASGDASRLQQSLVVGSQTAVDTTASNETGEIAGIFKISATVAPGHSLEQVEKLIADTITAVQASGVPNDELDRVKAKYRTNLLEGLTSPMQRTFVIGLGLIQHNDPHYYQSLFSRYDAVTTDDIQRVAAKYLVPERVELVVEPIQEGEEESEAVLAGPLPAGEVREPLELRQHASGPDWSAMPDATTSRPFQVPTIKRHTLSNGLHVWMARWDTLPLVSARLAVGAGSSTAPPAESGLARLTSKLWDQGTQNLTATELAEAVDALGTSLQIGTGTSTTQLGFTVETRAFPDILALVGEMIAAPRFDQHDFDRERKLQLSQLSSGPDDASWIATRVYPTLLFGMSHPYALPSEGYTEGVEQLTRQQVSEFYRDYFVPGNSVLIVVGDIEYQQTIDLLEAKFAAWQGTAPAGTVPAAAPKSEAEVVYLVDKPDAVQSVIAVGRTWKDRDDQSYFATRIGNRVLGGDFLSRINQNLRHRNGFTYGANSGFRYYKKGSNWNLTTSVRAEVTGAALREIMNELSAVGGDRPIAKVEVEVARSAEMSVFPQSFETPSSIASSLTQLAVYGLPDDYFQAYLSNLGSTVTDAVAEVMSEVIDPTQLRFLVVGDQKVVEPTLKEAGFEDIRLLDIDGHPQP